MEATQHAIYVTEQLIEQSFEGEDRSSYHTALWYVQERDGEADVVQQLHFNDHSDSFWEEDMGTVKMVPNVRYGLCRSQDPEKMGMVAVKRGHEAEILAYWNHMLAFSADVRQQQLTFDLQEHELLVRHSTVVGHLLRDVDTAQIDVAEVLLAGKTSQSHLRETRVLIHCREQNIKTDEERGRERERERSQHKTLDHYMKIDK